MIREALRGTRLDPSIRWLGATMRYYRKPKVQRMNARYDRQTVEILRRVPGNYLDIGAAGGTILRHMLQVSPGGHHVAFEPIPQMAERVRSRFPGVELHQVALSDHPGETAFNYAPRQPGRSGLKRLDTVTDVEVIPVRVEMLDNLIHDTVHVIKLDVEGAELAVLRGARGVLEKYHPIIVFEHGSAAAHFGTTPEDVWDYLASLDYRIWLLKRWLNGRGCLSRERFAREARSRNFYFVASRQAPVPAPTGAVPSG